GRYYIISSSGLSPRTVTLAVATGQPSPGDIGVHAGDTYTGAYELDSVSAKGGAVIVFGDAVVSSSITISGSGSKIQPPPQQDSPSQMAWSAGGRRKATRTTSSAD